MYNQLLNISNYVDINEMKKFKFLLDVLLYSM